MTIADLNGRTRTGIVVSGVWIVIFFIVALIVGSEARRGDGIPAFLAVLFGGGFLPVAIGWGIVWIRAAPK